MLKCQKECGAVLGVTVMAWLCAIGVGWSAETHIEVGMVYDNNLFKVPVDPQSGWISRFYFAYSGDLLKRPRSSVWLRCQVGAKRFWTAERSMSGESGAVLANHLNVTASSRVGRRVRLEGSGVLKVKIVNRVPGEEGYLRGALEGRIQCVFGQGFTSDLYYRFGGHDSRDMRLPEVISNEAGAGVQYGKSRRFRARLTGTWRWLDYNRAALAVDARGRIDELRFAQSDLLREVSAGVQLYRRVLVDLVYGFLLNTSNSYGYSFKAHRMQVLLVRHIGFQFDAQMLANLQLRRYDDPLAPLPGWDSEMDEYEQALLVLKLSRQLTNRLDLSLQYGFSRNGARRSGGFYRKHTCAISVAFSL